jgi:hypothetical protein
MKRPEVLKAEAEPTARTIPERRLTPKRIWTEVGNHIVVKEMLVPRVSLKFRRHEKAKKIKRIDETRNRGMSQPFIRSTLDKNHESRRSNAFDNSRTT